MCVQENWSLEYTKMKSKLELLHRNQKHYLEKIWLRESK
ncbi:unnamed protein product [Rhodiola kirilowii]